MRNILAAATSPFAHLLARTAGRPAAEDGGDDDEKDIDPKGAESDDDSDDGADEARRGKKAKKVKKAESGDDTDTDGDDADAKAEGDDEDEDDEEDDDGEKRERAAVKRERARCRAIFAAKAAAGRPDVAAHLAFDTNLSAKEAISLMSTVTAVAPGRGGLAGRMAGTNVPNPGAAAGGAPSASDPKAIAAAVIAAGKKRRGEA